MDRKIIGITLIELLMVLSIMAIILSIAIPQYTKWKKKYDVQEDVKNIYSLLQDARMRSFVEKRVCGLYWGTTSEFNQVSLRCDTDDDGDINDSEGYVTIINLKLKTNFESSDTYIKFSRGVAVNFNNIHSTNPNLLELNDCVVVSATRVKVGNWDGSKCN